MNIETILSFQLAFAVPDLTFCFFIRTCRQDRVSYCVRLEVYPGLERIDFAAGEGLSIGVIPFLLIPSAG